MLPLLERKAIQSVVYREAMTSKPLVAQFLFVHLFASRASSHYKNDMGSLSWLNAETFKKAPTPLFDGLVRCSAIGTLLRDYGISTKQSGFTPRSP